LRHGADEVAVDCGGKRSATPLSLAALIQLTHPPVLSQSGVALRLPPQSIRLLLEAALDRITYLS
jgi:hypothetical protein